MEKYNLPLNVIKTSEKLYPLDNTELKIIPTQDEENNITKKLDLLNYKTTIKPRKPYFEPKQPYNLCLNLDMPDIRVYDENGYGIDNKLAYYNDEVNNIEGIKSYNNI